MILLLDDDEEFRVRLVGHLRESGHLVSEFSSADAIEVDDPRRNGIIVIALDADAGGSDSLPLADHLHARYPHARVVIATAQRDLAAQPDVHAREFLYCFCKPLSSAALSRVVDVLLPPAARAA